MASYAQFILDRGTIAGYAAKEFVERGSARDELTIRSSDSVAPTERPPLSKGVRAGVDSGTPDAAPNGGGYRAIITSGDRIIWSSSHVHSTEHSAKACAEWHLAAVEPASAQEH
jgi:hypothetical protein